MADVKKSINFQLSKIVGCLTTHIHFDHAKYATEYSKLGVKIYGPKDIAERMQFPYDGYHIIQPDKTIRIGGFSVVPFHNFHDVEIYGYLIRHRDCGTILFSTDSYKIPITIRGVDHFIIEANYSDDILKRNVWNGKVDKQQADRIMLSHMSLQYTVKYLVESEGINASTVTLCHLSERNSDPAMFSHVVQGAIGVPCNIATKGLVVNLNKQVI